MNDLRHALRALARSPGFALAVVLSLALGIGTDVTMLGLVDSLLFRPPAHVRDVDRLVDIRVRTYPDYVDLRDQTRSFSGVAGWWRSEEHTSELQSPDHLVCRLLLE